LQLNTAEGRIIANSRDTNRSVAQRLDALAPLMYKPSRSHNHVLCTPPLIKLHVKSTFRYYISNFYYYYFIICLVLFLIIFLWKKLFFTLYMLQVLRTN